ncbi:unnamed protein product [Thelazia callipaeda]|uniref:DB domain-containing protein n=1 Tax=Thelazia callipaeda TaxID=103827 RepID=A0A0N5CWD8_THECL|nr:unnamed protein product [Thelazia callipaeda]
MQIINRTLFVVVASSVVSAKDRLPSCELIPKLLCCTDRVLDKCLIGCLTYVTSKCPHKMQNFEKIAPSSDENSLQETTTDFSWIEETTTAPTILPTTLPEFTTKSPRRQPIRKPMMLIKPTPSSQKLFELSDDGRVVSQQYKFEESSHKNYGDYIHLNQRYPITEVTDSNALSDCGQESSRPPFSPCLSRKLVDELFLTCCKQHVPTNCHSLCTYEHREYVAAEMLIQAIQHDVCDLKYLSNILYCANRNRDNRHCCQFLGLASYELGVGDRCLRMCNIAQSGDRIGTVEKNDLVCLSNWNVLMYCARAGLRTIN